VIIHGDSLEVLKTLEANSVDAVVTDPPYGWRFMGKAWDVPDIERMRQAEFNRPPRKDGKSRGRGDPSLVAGSYDVSKTGNWNFMIWTQEWATEVLRVLKPGGHMLVFCGPRTYHAMAMGVEQAGFEIRDQLQWLFGSGFPKAHNIGYGWGTALKPANEPIVLARKPLEKGLTVAKNVEKWGCGAINVDAGRIGTDEKWAPQGELTGGESVTDYGDGLNNSGRSQSHAQGRFPANVLFDEEAAAVLDEQALGQKLGRSGGNKHEKIITDENSASNSFGNNAHIKPGINSYSDSGGASRFYYVAKASKRERNAGLEGMPEREIDRYGECGQGATAQQTPRVTRSETNHHPTVKPIKLMQYLCKLITRPGGTILDPFMGSGTTGCAAVSLGFEFIGIEREAEYVEIARKRIGKSEEVA
jgi:site-specific DNA-methyltransferase (adenine-specific)